MRVRVEPGPVRLLRNFSSRLDRLEGCGGLRVAGPGLDVVLLGDRPGIAELVGDLADIEAGLVEQGADGLAPHVGGHPSEPGLVEGLAEPAACVGRVEQAAFEGGE
jgi:hypothetical protein